MKLRKHFIDKIFENNKILRNKSDKRTVRFVRWKSWNTAEKHWIEVNEIFHVHELEDNFATTACLPKLIYRLSVIPIKIPASIVREVNKFIPKCIWKCNRHRIATRFW